ncbi:MAG TPA: hypothetical protein VLX90_15765 [Steroidobacteraceae bacterium]|nr:hypothetical protein [Steroidobacteraceae bacterium]
MSVELGWSIVARSDAAVLLFEPGHYHEVEITIDGKRLEPVPGQTLVEHGPDRNLSVDDIGGIRLIGNASPARVRG